jgi:hypothetical protein
VELSLPEQLQVSDIFDDDRRRDVRNVTVGADFRFRFMHRSTESFGRGEGPAHRLCGLQSLALSIRQGTLGWAQAAATTRQKSPTRWIG